MMVSNSIQRLNELFDADPRSDTAIADALNVSKQAISTWRRGTRSPKKSVLIKIAEMYHVSVEWIMGFDVDRTLIIPDSKQFRRIILAMEPNDYETVMKIFEKTELAMRKRGEL